MVYAFSSNTRLVITEPVIGMCNLIRAIGRPWYNILWLDEGVKEVARKFTSIRRRVFGLIPGERNTILSRVAGVLTSILGPWHPGGTQSETIRIANGLMARYPRWIENELIRKLGRRLHLVVVNRPLVVLFGRPEDARLYVLFIIGNDLLVMTPRVTGDGDTE